MSPRDGRCFSTSSPCGSGRGAGSRDSLLFFQDLIVQMIIDLLVKKIAFAYENPFPGPPRSGCRSTPCPRVADLLSPQPTRKAKKETAGVNHGRVFTRMSPKELSALSFISANSTGNFRCTRKNREKDLHASRTRPSTPGGRPPEAAVCAG